MEVKSTFFQQDTPTSTSAKEIPAIAPFQEPGSAYKLVVLETSYWTIRRLVTNSEGKSTAKLNSVLCTRSEPFRLPLHGSRDEFLLAISPSLQKLTTKCDVDVASVINDPSGPILGLVQFSMDVDNNGGKRTVFAAYQENWDVAMEFVQKTKGTVEITVQFGLEEKKKLTKKNGKQERCVPQ